MKRTFVGDSVRESLEVEMTHTAPRTLDEQRAEFARNRFLAMPIAGTVVWSVIGIGGAFLPVGLAAWLLFIGTGSTFARSPRRRRESRP
jgi:hypothetical protein